MSDVQTLRDEISKATDDSGKQHLFQQLIEHAEAALEDFLNFAIFLRDSIRQPEQSLILLDETEKKYGENAWIEDNRARAYILLGETEKADECWGSAIAIAPEKNIYFIKELETLYKLINTKISQELTDPKKNKDWDDVIYILSNYRSKQQHNLHLYLELCIAYREKKNYKSALNILRLAEKSNLQSAWIHDNYSRIFFERKLYVKALRECLIALSLSDKSSKGVFIGLLKIIKKRIDEEHNNNKYLNIVPIDMDNILGKLFNDKVNPADIQLETSNKISTAECKSAFDDLGNKNNIPKTDIGVRLIAYYLPQFHPIVENNEWWGPGFTEWTNVAQAVPYFKDHYQPHIPGEFGYYDLRLPEVREAQARLAKEYGIYGFCYYYYWFSGRRLLERPLQEVFESGKPDFPFCICWANENWSRRWDGSEHEILVQQEHNEKTDEDFIHDVIPLLKDPRYIKVNGAPLLVVYRISLMPNPIQTAETWREICVQNGIPEIHLCMAETFGLTEPRQYGFDSSVQFPPHNMAAPLENDNIDDLPKDYTGNVYDFRNVVTDQLARELPTYKQFPGIMVSWDNTARKKKAGNVFTNSTPESYEIWLRGAVDRAKQSLSQGEQLVFINAWNEWAEGTHLEPDKKYGRAYLEATRRALTGNSDWELICQYAEQIPTLTGEAKKHFLADMRFTVERLTKVNEHLLSIMGKHGIPKHWTTMKIGLPSSWKDLKIFEAGVSSLELLNHYTHFEDQQVVIDSSQKLRIHAWAFHDANQVLTQDTPTYIILEDMNSADAYFAPLIHRHERSDVADYHKNTNIRFSGINTLIDVSGVSRGLYHLGVACRFEKRVIMTPFNVEVEIV